MSMRCDRTGRPWGGGRTSCSRSFPFPAEALSLRGEWEGGLAILLEGLPCHFMLSCMFSYF